MNKIIEFSKLVGKQLGKGFSECVYHEALCVHLRKNSIDYSKEQIMPITYNINNEEYVVGNVRSDIVLPNESIVIECKAIDMYINHLHRPEIDELRYFMLVKTLERLSQQLDHCKILILPGFHAIPGVEGTLMNICNGEFVSDKTQASWYDTHFIDPRPNHFGQDNHLILADRITEFFQTSKTVDLENGFKHGFL
jgi:GxxExxY protein